jgi:FixJ family two-component response regulator
MAAIVDIVDDDEAVRQALGLLIRAVGWQPRLFASGAEFLQRVQAAPPHCVVLDLNMPGMNGAEVQERLAQRQCRLPVVAITAQPGSPLASRAAAAGVRTVLEKPLHDGALIAAIELALAA